jgi:hypothetical protein
MSVTYDVTRHERRYDDTELAMAMGMPARGADGRLLPMLPPFERMQPKRDMAATCSCCGQRRGLHQWGDEACPDPAWRPASGRRQFLPGSFFEPAARIGVVRRG